MSTLTALRALLADAASAPPLTLHPDALPRPLLEGLEQLPGARLQLVRPRLDVGEAGASSLVGALATPWALLELGGLRVEVQGARLDFSTDPAQPAALHLQGVVDLGGPPLAFDAAVRGGRIDVALPVEGLSLQTVVSASGLRAGPLLALGAFDQLLGLGADRVVLSLGLAEAGTRALRLWVPTPLALELGAERALALRELELELSTPMLAGQRRRACAVTLHGSIELGAAFDVRVEVSSAHHASLRLAPAPEQDPPGLAELAAFAGGASARAAVVAAVDAGLLPELSVRGVSATISPAGRALQVLLVDLAFQFAGLPIRAWASFPDFTVHGALAPSTRVDLAALGARLLPGASLPALALDALSVQLQPSSGSWSLACATSEGWPLGPLSLEGVSLALDHGAGGTRAALSGVLRLGDVGLRLSGERAADAQGAGWHLSGELALAEPVSISALGEALLSDPDPGAPRLDALLEGFQVRALSVTFDSDTGAQVTLAGGLPLLGGLELRTEVTLPGSGATEPRRVTATAALREGVRLVDLLAPLGVKVPQVVSDPLASAPAPTVTVALGASLSVELTAGSLTLSLWRVAGAWYPRLQAGGVGLPSQLQVPALLSEVLSDTHLVWTPKAVPAEALGEAVDARLAVVTELPLNETAVGRSLGLSDRVPIALEDGQVSLEVSFDLLRGQPRAFLDDVTFRELVFGYRSPAEVSLAATCDITLPDSAHTTLRLKGRVDADLADQEVSFGLALLGEVRGGQVRAWQEPFGFPGLTIARLEVELGSSLRAFSGAVSVGRATAQLDAVVQKDQSAVYFHGEHLTVQDLLDGFTRGRAPTLPAFLGASGFEELEVDYCASPGPMSHTFPSGLQRSWTPGLRGKGKLNLLGMRFAAVVDLDQARFAGSMSTIRAGEVFKLEARQASIDVPSWAEGFTDAGGPWALVDGKAGEAELHASVVLLGFRRDVSASIDHSGLQLSLEDTFAVGSLLTWSASLGLKLFHGARGLDAEISGHLHAALKFNPRTVIDEALGVDLALLDLDLVDIAITLDVCAGYRDAALYGDLTLSLELWGEPFSVGIDVKADLTPAGLAELVKDHAGRFAVQLALQIGKMILKAVVAAIEAIGEVLKEIGAALVEAVKAIGRALEAIADAFEKLGEVLEEAGAEIASWFGDDSGKERLRREREAELARARAEEQRHRARARALREKRLAQMLDLLEHLAEGAAASKAMKDEVQARIDAYGSTLPFNNPFTQQAEFQAVSRAYYQGLWDEAVARAERRAALRQEYERVVQAARAELADLERARARTQEDADQAEAELAAIREAQRDLKADLAAMEDARVRAQQAVAVSREGAARVEAALDEATWLTQLVTTEQGRVRSAQAAFGAVGGGVDPSAGDETQAQTILGDAASPLQEAEARAQLARREAQAAADRVLQARVALESLTLTRLEAVLSLATSELTAHETFKAWMDLSQSAGGAARVRLEGRLHDDALSLLGALPDLTRRALVDGAAQATAALADLPDALPPPSPGLSAAELEGLMTQGSAGWSAHARGLAARWTDAQLDAGTLPPGAAPLLPPLDPALQPPTLKGPLTALLQDPVADGWLSGQMARGSSLAASKAAQRLAELVVRREATRARCEIADVRVKADKSLIDRLAKARAELQEIEDRRERKKRLAQAVESARTHAARAEDAADGARKTYDHMKGAVTIIHDLLSPANIGGQILGGLSRLFGGPEPAPAATPSTEDMDGHMKAAEDAVQRAANAAADARKAEQGMAPHAAIQEPTEPQVQAAEAQAGTVHQHAIHAGTEAAKVGVELTEAMTAGNLLEAAQAALQHVDKGMLTGLAGHKAAISDPIDTLVAVGQRVVEEFKAVVAAAEEAVAKLKAVAPEQAALVRSEAELAQAQSALVTLEGEIGPARAAFRAAAQDWVERRCGPVVSLARPLLEILADPAAARQLAVVRGQGAGVDFSSLSALRAAAEAPPTAQVQQVERAGEQPLPTALTVLQVQAVVDWGRTLTALGAQARAVQQGATQHLSALTALRDAALQDWPAAAAAAALGDAQAELEDARAQQASLVAQGAQATTAAASALSAVDGQLSAFASITARARQTLSERRTQLDAVLADFSQLSVTDTLALDERGDAVLTRLEELDGRLSAVTDQLTQLRRAQGRVRFPDAPPRSAKLPELDRALQAAGAVKTTLEDLQASIGEVQDVLRPLRADLHALSQDTAQLRADVGTATASLNALVDSADDLIATLRETLADLEALAADAAAAHHALLDTRLGLERCRVGLSWACLRLSVEAARHAALARMVEEANVARALRRPAILPLLESSRADRASLGAARAARDQRARGLSRRLQLRRARLAMEDLAYGRRLHAAFSDHLRGVVEPQLAQTPALDPEAYAGPVETTWVLEVHSEGDATLVAMEVSADGYLVTTDTIGLGGAFHLARVEDAEHPNRLSIRSALDGRALRLDRWPQLVPEGLAAGERDVAPAQGSTLAWPFETRLALDGEPLLEAEGVGERYGQPTFRLSQGQGDAKRWLAWTPGGVLHVTPDAHAAAEVALRARLATPLADGDDTPLHPAYGVPGERPADTSRALGLSPVTGRAAALARRWRARLRAALRQQLGVREDWLTAQRHAADRAIMRLRAAGWRITLRRRERSRWQAALAALTLRTQIHDSRLPLHRSATLDRGADAPSPGALSLWLRAGEGVAGDVVQLLGADGGVLAALALASDAEGGLNIRAGDLVTPLSAGDWRHVTLSWRGVAAALLVDGVQVASGPLKVSEVIARVVVGGIRGAGGDLEQVALWGRARDAAAASVEMQQGLGGQEPGLLSVLCRVTADAEWQRCRRGGAGFDGTSVPLPEGVEVRPTTWLARTRRWRERLARAAAASDPIASLMADLATSDGAAPTALSQALAADGARLTDGARSWSPELLRAAISSWRPGRAATAQGLRAEARRVGIELGALADDVALRTLALAAAAKALSDPTARGLDRAQEVQWIRLEQRLLLPLLPVVDDNWMVQAMAAGTLSSDLEADVAQTPDPSPSWARSGPPGTS
ncbi:MAG: hypothetical protein H6739_39910 [Alphaproteobacteria bacterium]|nr:hypothetical protein [Alphaproteobacteria bacterium]